MNNRCTEVFEPIMEKIIAFARKCFSPKTVRYLFRVYLQLPYGIKAFLYRTLFTYKSTQPQISCICPTYGRVDLLEEAIHSFIKQDYQGPKELVILNDCAEQTLIFDHPEVRIINLPRRMRTLGEKYKAAVGLCSYDLIFVWHDDDVYLPHRLSHAVKHHFMNKPDFNPKVNRSFYSANKAWIWNGQRVSGLASGRFPGGSSWTRRLFTTVRGYAHVNHGYEEEIETQFAKHIPSMNIDDIGPEEIYHIQRQAETNSYQLPDPATDEVGNIYDNVANFVQKQAERGEIKSGCIELEPQWRTDYSELVRKHLSAETIQGVAK